MKRRIPFLLLIVSLVGLPFHGAYAAVEGGLPSSWYNLPEDGAALRVSAEEERGKEQKAAALIERMLKSNSEALDRVSTTRDTNPVAGRGDWKFSAFMLDLGLSASGVLGVLVAKGEATAQLYWRPNQTARLDEQALDSDPADLSFRGDETRDQIEVKLEPVVRAVMATGDVKDGPALRKNLLDTVLKYQEILQDVAFPAEREWVVSKLRLDFSIDISGKVQPTITVGGGLRLRFEWEPTPGTRNVAHRPLADKEELKKLLTTLSDSMTGLNYAQLTPTHYEVKSLKFGLGIFGEGKFAVVKVGASVMGHLYLAKKAVAHPIVIPQEEMLDTIPLIESGEQPQHVEYADQIGVHYTSWSYNGERGKVFQVPKEAFKKGMEKAVKMSAYLAGRANRSQGKRWELYQIKAEFALSLSGSVGILSLGGTGALEMAFQKTSKTL